MIKKLSVAEISLVNGGICNMPGLIFGLAPTTFGAIFIGTGSYDLVYCWRNNLTPEELKQQINLAKAMLFLGSTVGGLGLTIIYYAIFGKCS